MKKKLFIVILLIASFMLAALPVSSADFDAGVGKEEIPYGEFAQGSGYRYTTFNMMTEDEAKANGVPEGYSGYVLELNAKNGSGVGIGLDLTKYRVADIESITFRVYCPAGTKNNGVRIGNSSADSWIMLANPGANEEWVEVVLSEASNFNTSQKSFEVFDDGTGYCKRVNFCFRFDGNSDATAYIDHITVKLRDPDTKAPVISYDGETDIKTTAGKIFTVDATAYDEYDKTDIEPEYIFSEGAVDANGLLLEGQHTCTVKFTDFSGNSSTIELTLSVEPKDVTAPVLSWTAEKLYADNGMMPILNITATDDRDGDVNVALIWSEGALYRGKLVTGEHTLTLIAEDSTGNKVEKIIPVTVTE